MNVLDTESARLLTAVRSLLEQKGIVSTAEVQERMAITDSASQGRVRAWSPAPGSIRITAR